METTTAVAPAAQRDAAEMQGHMPTSSDLTSVSHQTELHSRVCASSRTEPNQKETGPAAAAAAANADGKQSATKSLPQKCIRSTDDLQVFLSSASYRELTLFCEDLGNAIKGAAIALGDKGSPPVAKICELLDEFQELTQRFPPIQQAMRFGNKAFQPWLDAVHSLAATRLSEMMPANLKRYVPELAVYLEDSFGNRTRIDYGTGHEFNFLCFLFCLCKIGYFCDADKRDIVLVGFKRYLELMRTLQSMYLLEPAGSRGVWGLDDYHFLPFLWGSAQLQLQEDIAPHQICDAAIINEYSNRYLYVGAIKVILETKKGVPFGECSPLLNDITLVPSWKKVNTGLLKMYDGEVLRKLPVAQHFCFGTLIPFGDN